MIELNLPSMTCGHCVKAVTQAVQQADPAATVVADLATHRVRIETTAPRDVLVAQLSGAGYEPA